MSALARAKAAHVMRSQERVKRESMARLAGRARTPGIHPYAEPFPSLPEPELAALAQDIKRYGLREPITLYRGFVLDGHNRLLACRKAHVEPRFEDFPGGDGEALSLLISRNVLRRHLNESQRALVAARLARLGVGANQRPRQRGEPEGAQICAPSQSDAAALLGVSRRSVQHARRVEERAAREIIEAVACGKLAISAAAELAAFARRRQREAAARIVGDPGVARRIVQQLKREARLEQIARTARAQADAGGAPARFAVLYADPPWQYEYAVSPSRAVENHYPTLSDEEICAIRPFGRSVRELAAEAAVLCLWVPAPLMLRAPQIIAAWGFQYRSQFAWDKETAGTGYWVRGQHELLLIAVRGAMPAPAPAARYSSVIRARRSRLHSRKPEVVYEMIERMCPGLPRLELFARTRRPGWTAWGNQVTSGGGEKECGPLESE